MGLYCDTTTRKLLTENELREKYYTAVLAVNEEDIPDAEEHNFESWLREAISWGHYYPEENEDAR